MKKPRTPKTKLKAEEELGIEVSEITEQLRERFKINASGGVIIARVARGSLASEAGFRPGDVIVEVNGDAVGGLEEYHDAVAEHGSSGTLLFLIERGGRTIYLGVKDGARVMIEEKLAELGIELAEKVPALGSYVPATVSGNLIFVSGQLPVEKGKLLFMGKVGSDLTVEGGLCGGETCGDKRPLCDQSYLGRSSPAKQNRQGDRLRGERPRIYRTAQGSKRCLGAFLRHTL